MKNKLVLSTIFVSMLLISACKNGSGTNSQTSSATSSSDYSFNSSDAITGSSPAITGPSSLFSIKCDSSVELTLSSFCATSILTISGKEEILLDCYLSDASVNYKTGMVYTPNADGSAIAKETSVTNEQFASEMLRRNNNPRDIYYAAAFFLTANMLMESGSTDVGFFLDMSETTFNTYGNQNIAKGYRIAFIADSLFRQSPSVTKVYAPLQMANNCKYVSSMTDFAGTSYDQNDLIAVDNQQTWPYALASRNEYTNRNDYLGYFKGVPAQVGGSAYATMSFCVLVWLEGTDPNVLNSNVPRYDALYSTLAFKTADLPSN